MNARRRAIIDNSALCFLVDELARERFRKNLHIADMHLWPSAINVAEAINTKNLETRQKLLSVLRELKSPDLIVLPSPHELLRQSGLAFINGSPNIVLRETVFDRMLSDTNGAIRYQDRVQEALNRVTTQFDKMHDNARSEVLKEFRENGIVNEWENTEDFLMREWRPGESPSHFAELAWKGLKLPGEVPQGILENETWRMWIDIDGAGIFERTIAKKFPKRTHRFDWLQIPYLSFADQRVLITNDKAFEKSASQILASYPNVRVLNIEEFMS